MKKIIYIAIVAVLLGACTGKQVKYSVCITGVEDGTEMLLTDKLTDDVINSGSIADGELTLTGKADKDALLCVQKSGDELQTVFFADGEPVKIDLGEKSLEGSELNEKLSACDKETSDMISDVIMAIAEYGELGEEEQIIKAAEINAKIEEISSLFKRILEENRDNLIPAAFISDIAQSVEDEEQEDLFDEKYVYAKHPCVLKVKKQLEEYNAKMQEADAVKNGLVGQRFIDLEEPDTDGNMHKLSEFVGRGKWVLIDFWASWCGPCRREMPNVVAAYEKYHGKGLDIVGLSFDNDKDAWLKAIADLKMPWIHLSDLKGWETVASDTYGVKSIPASLLVDPEGIVVARDLRGDDLGAKLAEVLGE